jgi:hypothetical protein
MAIKSLGNLSSYYNDYLSQTGKDAQSSVQVQVNTSGGTIIVSDTNVYHVFTNTGEFIVTSGIITANVLIVSGGGGGAGGQGGGGGAGGVVYGPSIPLSPGPYSVTIGLGGSGGNDLTDPGTQGSPSSFNSVTAIGGGGGIRNNYGYPSPESPNAAGGSSGGAGGGGLLGGPNATPVTPQPVPGSYIAYGNIGGAQIDIGSGAGGGGGGAGGAATAGGNNPTPTRGIGGAGQPFPEFPAPVLAPAIPAPVRSDWTTAVGPTGLFGGGGGGGGSTTYPVLNPNGGPGGGGNGAIGNGNAVNYTGGGGGGEYYPLPAVTGGTGGTGIVIIQYDVV